jgi:hypothetical protein
MKVELYHRHHGVHALQREAEISGGFADYATLKDGTSDEYAIDEAKLIAALPDGFLPAYPRRRCLLAVADENGGTGQAGLSEFRDWAKYFDCFCLTLVKAEVAPGDQETSPDPTVLGADACLAIMRELYASPIKMKRYNPADPLNDITEATPAGAGETRCVVLTPMFDMVSVCTRLRGWGMGLYDYAVLTPGAGQLEDYIYVQYPSDPALITGPEYGRELRAAIVKALDALKTDAPAPAS